MYPVKPDPFSNYCGKQKSITTHDLCNFRPKDHKIIVLLSHVTSCDSHLTILWRRERLESRVFEGFQLFLYLQEFFPLCVFSYFAIFRSSNLCMHVLDYVFHQAMNFLELRKQSRSINFLKMRK